jgi:predicted RNase H-like HicB family nuclease
LVIDGKAGSINVINKNKNGSDSMKLHVLLEKDEEGFFVAEVPALPGCLSQGKTEEEALSNIKEAVEGWLEVMESKQKVDPNLMVEVSI